MKLLALVRKMSISVTAAVLFHNPDSRETLVEVCGLPLRLRVVVFFDTELKSKMSITTAEKALAVASLEEV
jgi:hypothetical protein